MDNKRQLSSVERQDEIWRFVQNDHLPETMTDRATLGIGRQVVIVTDTPTPPDFADALASKGIRALTV